MSLISTNRMALIDIKKALQNYGLEDREIKVYLAVLRLGSATVQEIAKLSKVKRTTTYLVCEKLIVKGILGQYKAKYGTHYVASPAKSLVKKLNDIRSEVEDILPELEAIEKKELFEPSVKFFKGKEGYLNILNDSLEGYSHEIIYLGSEQILSEIISEKYITEKYIPERIKRNIKFKELVLEEEFSLRLKENAHKELRQIKFLPKGFKPLSNTLIYQDKVAYFSSKKELSVILIESKDIANTERQKFELLWLRD